MISTFGSRRLTPAWQEWWENAQILPCTSQGRWTSPALYRENAQILPYPHWENTQILPCPAQGKCQNLTLHSTGKIPKLPCTAQGKCQNPTLHRENAQILPCPGEMPESFPALHSTGKMHISCPVEYRGNAQILPCPAQSMSGQQCWQPQLHTQHKLISHSTPTTSTRASFAFCLRRASSIEFSQK